MNFCQTTYNPNPEENSLQIHSCEKLKPYLRKFDSVLTWSFYASVFPVPTKQTRGFRRLSTRFISCRQLQRQPTNVRQKSGKYKKRKHSSWQPTTFFWGFPYCAIWFCVNGKLNSETMEWPHIFKNRNVKEEILTFRIILLPFPRTEVGCR